MFEAFTEVQHLSQQIAMRTAIPTTELRETAEEKHGAIEGGQQALGNLTAYVAEIALLGTALMASQVFFSVSMSLDSFIAPESPEELMRQQWMDLLQWMDLGPDAGEHTWPEDAPFHTPVFMVTHEKRDPRERPGGTTFLFVNDGTEAALDRARQAAAGDPDIRIAGGATILAYLNAGLCSSAAVADST